MNYKEYYENVAELLSFWDLPHNAPKYYQDRIRYDFILKYLPKTTQRILDLDCGDGYLSYLLANQGKKITSVDLSSNRLKKFEKVSKTHNINRVQTDVIQTGLSSTVFDVIICSEVIEHIENFQDVIKEAFRLLKPCEHLLLLCHIKQN